jgi:hypothetical protein
MAASALGGVKLDKSEPDRFAASFANVIDDEVQRHQLLQSRRPHFFTFQPEF